MNALPIYLTVELISLIFLRFALNEKNKNPVKTIIVQFKYVILIIISISFIFFTAALRHNVGTDYIAYSNAYLQIARLHFLELPSSSLLNWLGIGFIILCKIIALFFGSNYLWFHAIIALLTTLFLYKAILYKSRYPLLSLYLYFSFCLYYNSLNQSKQALAIAIILFSYKFIKEKNLKRFITFIIIAGLIHTSAFVFIFAYFLNYIKFNKKTLSISLVILVIGFFNFDYIINLLEGTSYAGYLGSQYDQSFTNSSILNSIYRGVLFVACLLFLKQVIKRDNTNKLLYFFAAICLILQLLTLKSHLFGRVTTYFYIFYIYLIPEVVYCIISPFYKKITMIILAILYFVFHLYYYFNTPNFGVYIYNMI